jgi:hypothetical protein
MACVEDSPVARVETDLLCLRQNGFEIFGEAWRCFEVEALLLLAYQIADERGLGVARLVRNGMEAEEE